jgi:hypothetical protein
MQHIFHRQFSQAEGRGFDPRFPLTKNKRVG